MSHQMGIRLDIKAIPREGAEPSFVMSSRLAVLKKNLEEKCGPDATRIFNEWMHWCFVERECRDELKAARGGGK